MGWIEREIAFKKRQNRRMWIRVICGGTFVSLLVYVLLIIGFSLAPYIGGR